MLRTVLTILIAVFLATPQALAADRLSASEMRKVVPGNWSGNYKKSSLVLSIGADGTVRGSFAGIPARGRWTTRRIKGQDRICLTFASIISDTKCGELFRQGNNVLFGYLNRGKPRLRLRRS